MLNTAHLYILGLSLLGVANAAIGPEGKLTLVNGVISPDGFDRSAVLPGGTFPGTLIQGTKGDRFRLDVVNSLTDSQMLRSTSIHWHGIHQYGTNWADGVSFVTQCPIAANDSFLYDFKVDIQAGTYWYHSHLSTQYCDGLRGPLIIYDPEDPYKRMYDYDDESTIITLADWYHVYARQQTGAPPVAQSTLINGRGRYTGGPAVPLSVINVKPLKRYRFRIIGMSCDPNFIFSIDKHNLTVIEADGENTSPVTVDSIQVFAGQRYSAIFVANQPVGNYWIRANPNAPRGFPGFDGGRNSAILRYEGAPEEEPTTELQPSVAPLKETDLHPLSDLAAPGHPVPGGADVVITLKQGFNTTIRRFTMNDVPYVPPTTPVLLQILSGAHSAQELLPHGSLYELPPNKVVELVIPGTVKAIGGPHPWHLHGHSFSVVRSADSATYNFINPVRRDTVNTGFEDSNTTIRFVTDNAGPWFLHCHIDWHLELGLAVVFAENIPDTEEHNKPIPSAWNELCPRYDSLTPDQL